MAKQKNWENIYNIIDELGEGGNAKVYLVKDKSTGERFALKELYNKNAEKKVRFINEIHIAKENAVTVPGIIPIFDFNEEEYWYTMPIATKIQDYVNNQTIYDIVLGVIQLAETLEKLHEKEISHRDIKPSNIYYFKNRYFIGDFGLVNFPDNTDDFTRSDKGLGAIFTIAPEMKRNPKHADGKKADVYSLAKSLWMLLAGDDKGFEGVYNYLDSSHSLRYIKKYRNTHLVELEELLKDATKNDPDLRPNIKEFKERLNKWVSIYFDSNKAQASDWNFLNRQLFGMSSPESSTWRDINKIVDVLNIVGKTPAYNHMLFSDGGGLDFSYAKLAAEDGCIYIYDTLGLCFVVKPKCLCYEGFNENYKWNYFLLELDKLNPIFQENDVVNYEYLVEDKPAHYVDATYANYGVYDYDSGEPLPQGYKIVRRYLKGKFLIVMKTGPYNSIIGTYDGRHGLCSSSDFREYIEKLIELYSDIYNKVKLIEKYSKVDDEIERRILNLDVFNRNPFYVDMNFPSLNIDVKKKYEEIQKSKSYIKDNYTTWCFKEIIEIKDITKVKIKYCYKFILSEHICSFLDDEPGKYICKDGYIKELKSNTDDNCYYIYDRKNAIKLRNKIQKNINEILCQNGLSNLDESENCIKIEFVKCGKPSHLFTKQEIEDEMRKADDRVHNQLVIDEDGYARVIKDEGYGKLYPVRHEPWHAGNMNVGKYSNLMTLHDYYISSLQGWLLYLKTGEGQYIDYVDDSQDEEVLLSEILRFY